MTLRTTSTIKSICFVDLVRHLNDFPFGAYSLGTLRTSGDEFYVQLDMHNFKFYIDLDNNYACDQIVGEDVIATFARDSYQALAIDLLTVQGTVQWFPAPKAEAVAA